MKETVELQTATDGKTTEGKPSKEYTKAVDLQCVVLQVDSHVEQNPRGTVTKKQFEVYLKGSPRHAAMITGNGMKVRGVECVIIDPIDFPGRLIQFKIRER